MGKAHRLARDVGRSFPRAITTTAASLRNRDGRVQTFAGPQHLRLTSSRGPPRVAGRMGRHRGFILISILTVIAGVVAWSMTRRWEGWEYILDIVGKGDNMPIAGLIPIITFFTYLALDEAFRHDRLIKQGREDEVLDEMYR